MSWQDRTIRLLGGEAVERLSVARVAVFGLGAVGSYAVEGLARAGIGHFHLVDFDVFKPSNLNRQLHALHSTLGRPKAETAAERILDINPAAVVKAETAFAHSDTLDDLLGERPDLVIDAVDSLAPKTEVIAAGASLGLTVFSAMGAATRLNPEAIRFAPIMTAMGCPLVRLVKKRLRRRRIEGDLWCVYSEEPKNPDAVALPEENGEAEDGEEYSRGRRRSILGSISTITGMFGLRLAHEAILRLAGITLPQT